MPALAKPAAAAPKAKPSAAKPKKAAAGPSHPAYFEMIKEAIAALKDRTGSSSVAIAKYIEEKHGKSLPANFKKMLSVQLRASASKGKLVKVKASYKLSDAAKKDAPKPKPKAKPAAPKAAAKPAKDAAKPKKKAAAKPKEGRRRRCWHEAQGAGEEDAGRQGQEVARGQGQGEAQDRPLPGRQEGPQSRRRLIWSDGDGF
uniref:H15 domain-containing protein n=1 Tax=Triticum urartu TaxID=4572 RepID=A0A8R7PHM9_TRIUA